MVQHSLFCCNSKSFGICLSSWFSWILLTIAKCFIYGDSQVREGAWWWVMMASQPFIGMFLTPFTALKQHVLTCEYLKPQNKTAYVRWEPNESIKITYYYSIQQMLQSWGEIGHVQIRSKSSSELSTVLFLLYRSL